MRLGRQAGIAVLLIGFPPCANRRGVDAEKLCHLGRLVAFANSLNGQASSPFQFCGRAFCSHAQVYALSTAEDLQKRLQKPTRFYILTVSSVRIDTPNAKRKQGGL